MHPFRLVLVFAVILFTVTAVLTLHSSGDQQDLDRTLLKFDLVQADVANRALRADVPPEPAVEHIHEHVAVRLLVDGVLVTVPDGLGVNVTDGSFAAIHTHDSSSVVHLHRPQGADPFTLRQLFAVWGVPTSATTLADREDLTMTVNGTAVPFTLDRPFTDRDDIVITVGASVEKTLQRFPWERAPVA